MKIIINSWKDSDWLAHETMKIDGKRSLSVHPLSECPEDAIIGRDLVSCSDVADLMSRAHAAGKAGELFECEYINGEED
jgi:hypothetical protein